MGVSMPDDQAFDYVIVGAGSAGCLLANRLSADSAIRVALVEAGPSDKGLLARLLINIPAGLFGTLGRPTFNYMYNYEADDREGAQPIYCPRGRVLGGTSAINGMVYTRGHRADYDQWAALGADGWSYDEVLPFFRKTENWQRGQSPFHGNDGELHVVDPQDPHPISEALVAAAEKLQFRRNPDFNGVEQEGFGHFQLTQWQGQRLSSAAAFLRPAEQRPNLSIIVGTQVTRVLLDAKRATGVEMIIDGKPTQLRARREVILSAGSIGSPQLLLLSGIGPGDQLRHHGIDVQHDLPGVGMNLQDHQDVMLCFSSRDPSLYGLSWKALPWIVASPFKYMFKRMGPLTTNTVESGGFVRSSADKDRPDLEFLLGPELMNQREHLIPRGHGFSVHISMLAPKSRGQISLASPDPAAAPRIRGNFLSHPDDLTALRNGFRLVRRLIATPPMADYCKAEVLPGPDVATDAAIDRYIQTTLGTTFHPVGTCRMGVDAQAVVDPQLRLRGVDGLRVVDASVMPTIISAPTNAAVYMIAEKASAMIVAAQKAG